MDIIQLKYVVELAHQCNFSRAADNLYITQPALSQQIQKLENEIGFPLFSRSTKRVELTFAGQQFVSHAEAALKEFSALEEFTAQTARTVNDTIIFGTSTHSSKHVSTSIPIFTAEFPHAHFRYKEAWDPELIEMLLNKQLDIALVVLPKERLIQPELKIYPLYEDFICIIVAENNPLACRESVSLSELEQRKLIFSSPESVIKRIVIDGLGSGSAAAENALDFVSKDARVPLLAEGAVCFSMYNRQLRSNMNGLRVIPVIPHMDLVFCLATHAKDKLTVIKRGFLDIAGREIKADLNKTR